MLNSATSWAIVVSSQSIRLDSIPGRSRLTSSDPTKPAVLSRLTRLTCTDWGEYRWIGAFQSTLPWLATWRGVPYRLINFNFATWYLTQAMACYKVITTYFQSTYLHTYFREMSCRCCTLLVAFYLMHGESEIENRKWIRHPDRPLRRHVHGAEWQFREFRALPIARMLKCADNASNGFRKLKHLTQHCCAQISCSLWHIVTPH